MPNKYERLSPSERSRNVGDSFACFDAVTRKYSERFPTPPDLRQTYIDIGSRGIWGKLNSQADISPLLDPTVPLAFTGQQPTADWGIYRRFAKRSGIHEGVTTVHHHADHDHAGKNGFGEVTLPVYTQDGITYKTYRLTDKFQPEDIMHEVPVPTPHRVSGFFDAIIEDVKDNPHAPKTASTALIEDCRDFILENHHLIRSAAELNAAVQSYLIRRISPQTRTVDVMLSDFLKTPIADKALGSLMQDMPRWISAYNQAVPHVSQTDYGKSHQLPKRLQEIDTPEGQLNELPIWALQPNGHGEGARTRSRAWMRQNGQKIEFGVYEQASNRFTSLMESRTSAPVEDLIANPNFHLFTPGALALVDMIRSRLHVPVIHGKTGHMYEAINELVNAIKDGEYVPDGMLVYPNSQAEISPITAVSHPTKVKGREATELKKCLESLTQSHRETAAAISAVNSQTGELFKSTTHTQSQIFAELDLDPKTKANKIKPGHSLHGLGNEVRALFTGETTKFPAAEKLNDSQGLTQIVMQLYMLASEMGQDEFNRLISKPSNGKISQLWKAFGPWVDQKDQLAKLQAQKTDLGKKLEAIEIRKKVLEGNLTKDTSVIEAAIYNPQAVKAIHRLEKAKSKNRGSGSDDSPAGTVTSGPDIPPPPSPGRGDRPRQSNDPIQETSSSVTTDIDTDRPVNHLASLKVADYNTMPVSLLVSLLETPTSPDTRREMLAALRNRTNSASTSPVPIPEATESDRRPTISKNLRQIWHGTESVRQAVASGLGLAGQALGAVASAAVNAELRALPGQARMIQDAARLVRDASLEGLHLGAETLAMHPKAKRAVLEASAIGLAFAFAPEAGVAAATGAQIAAGAVSLVRGLEVGMKAADWVGKITGHDAKAQNEYRPTWDEALAAAQGEKFQRKARQTAAKQNLLEEISANRQARAESQERNKADRAKQRQAQATLRRERQARKQQTSMPEIASPSRPIKSPSLPTHESPNSNHAPQAKSKTPEIRWAPEQPSTPTHSNPDAQSSYPIHDTTVSETDHSPNKTPRTTKPQPKPRSESLSDYRHGPRPRRPLFPPLFSGQDPYSAQPHRQKPEASKPQPNPNPDLGTSSESMTSLTQPSRETPIPQRHTPPTPTELALAWASLRNAGEEADQADSKLEVAKIANLMQVVTDVANGDTSKALAAQIRNALKTYSNPSQP